MRYIPHDYQKYCIQKILNEQAVALFLRMGLRCKGKCERGKGKNNPFFQCNHIHFRVERLEEAAFQPRVDGEDLRAAAACFFVHLYSLIPERGA